MRLALYLGPVTQPFRKRKVYEFDNNRDPSPGNKYKVREPFETKLHSNNETVRYPGEYVHEKEIRSTGYKVTSSFHGRYTWSSAISKNVGTTCILH